MLFLQQACQVDTLDVGHRTSATQTMSVTHDSPAHNCVQMVLEPRCTGHRLPALTNRSNLSASNALLRATCKADSASDSPVNQSFRGVQSASNGGVSGSVIRLPDIKGHVAAAVCQTGPEECSALQRDQKPLPALAMLQQNLMGSGEPRCGSTVCTFC